MDHRSARRLASLLLTATTAATLTAVTPAATAAGPDAITVEVTVPPWDRGVWHRTATTVTLDVDSPSGALGPGSVHRVTVDDGTTETPLTPGTNRVQVGEGVNTVSWRATNPATLATEAEGQVVVRVDTTRPTISLDRGIDQDAVLLLGQEVPMRFSCADNLSGLSECETSLGQEGEVFLDTSTVGRHNFAVFATDGAGNTANLVRRYYVVRPDGTAPTVERTLADAQPAESGWFSREPVVRFTATDPFVSDEDTSGLEALATDLDGVVTEVTSSTTDVVVPEGRHVLKWAARDKAGNASGIGSTAVDVDLTDPQVVPTYPDEGQHLDWRSSVTPGVVCDDDLSGIERCYTRVDGVVRSSLDLTPGPHTVEFIATDRASRGTVVRRRYVVDAPDPVRSATTLSRVRASRTGAGRARVVIRSKLAPAGRVVVLDGRRRLVSSAVEERSARHGRSVLTLRLPRLARGVHQLTARYGGSPTVRRSTSAPVTVRIR